MKYFRIRSVHDLGEVVRSVRKASGVRQDDVAGSVGVSHVFMRDLERGKETAQIGRALQVLQELGVKVSVEIPDDVFERLTGEQVEQRTKMIAARSRRLVEPMLPKKPQRKPSP